MEIAFKFGGGDVNLLHHVQKAALPGTQIQMLNQAFDVQNLVHGVGDLVHYKCPALGGDLL